MPMTKAQVREYKQQFDAELSVMTVSEFCRWNPRLSVVDARHMISRAAAATSKLVAGSLQQKTLF